MTKKTIEEAAPVDKTKKAKEQLKLVNAQLAKLKAVKAVQNYVKAAKIKARLMTKISGAKERDAIDAENDEDGFVPEEKKGKSPASWKDDPRLKDFPDAEAFAKALDVKPEDYLEWMEGTGFGDADKFEAKCRAVVGDKAYEMAEGYARTENLMGYALKLKGYPDKVGGISMKAIMDKFPVGAKGGKSAPGAKKRT